MPRHEIIVIDDDDDDDEGEVLGGGAKVSRAEVVVKEEDDLGIDWDDLMASSEEEEEEECSVAHGKARGRGRKRAGPSRAHAEVRCSRSGGLKTRARGWQGSVSDNGEEGDGEEQEEDAEVEQEEDGGEDGQEEGDSDEGEEPEEEKKEEEEEWEPEEEEGEEEEEDEVEMDEDDGSEEQAGEEPRRIATVAGRNGRAVINRGAEIFGIRLFEGWYIAWKADTTGVEKPVAARTRSQRGCLDMKLLKQATCSKPYCVDTPSGPSSEDTPPPSPPPARLPQPSSSCEEDSSGGTDRRAAARKRRRRELSSDDDFKEDNGDPGTVARGGRQREHDAPHHDDALKEDGGGDHGTAAARRRQQREQNAHGGGDNNNDDDSDEDRPFVVSRRPKRGGAADGCNQQGQGDVSFKKNSLVARMAARRARCRRETYDDLIDSLFEGVERYPQDGSSPGGPGGEEEHSWSGSTLEQLPLIFSFGDEDEVVQEKTEQSKFVDELWAEFDFAMESLNVCSHACQQGETRQEVPVEKTTACSRGKHDLILDEQIGVRCKHCDFVDIEIRDIFPSMVKPSMERELAIDRDLDLIFDDILKSMGYEDASNFGGHKTGLVWDLIPGVRGDMFPHQKEGFEFMWKKLAGGIDIEQLKYTVNSDTTSGCVISHAPGTGKTRLAITFVQSYLELFPRCRPVIIAPRGMLATWEQEFRKWNVKLPFHVLSSSEIQWSEDKTIQKLIAQDKNLGQKLSMNKLSQKSKLMVKLASWYQGSSIIGLSYSLYRRLASDEGVDGDTVRKQLLENPGLLVLDEGHTPRNKKSRIWKVLAEVSTEKRIILSGTPFQNSFLELYNILCLVKPKFARDFACTRLDKKGFASKRTNQSRGTPHLEEDKGKEFWTSLRISNVTDENISEIREKLDPFVHIHNGDILHKSLPGLRESVVILNPLPHQKEIITMMEKSAGKGFLDAEYKISLASIHPFLVTSIKLSDEEASVVDKLKSSRLNPCEGVKTRFVLEIVCLCEALKERVLVFSQYLEPLSLIMDQLTRKFTWTEGKEILLMSGNVRVKQREALMEAFNDMNSEAKVMLASTKACCEGITLVGASRVVLLDVVWNPSVGRQAIGRAYRIGQEKIVYTYNLIAEGTKEKVKYDRQAKKDHMSKLLFSNEPQPTGCNLSPELMFNDRVLEAMTAHQELKDMFVQILPSH